MGKATSQVLADSTAFSMVPGNVPLWQLFNTVTIIVNSPSIFCSFFSLMSDQVKPVLKIYHSTVILFFHLQNYSNF